MADYIVETIHDLLVSNLKSITDSTSSQGSHHPSRECFMVEIVDDTHREATPEGHIASANNDAPHSGNGTPPRPADGRRATVDTEVLPHLHMNYLRERQRELKTA
jgi:hypothetical protein